MGRSGIVPADTKAQLVFWRIKFALPGHRAFSKYLKNDNRISNRINMDIFPTDPHEQNSKWYSIYKKHQNAPSVSEAHRNFLLARDICSISFICLIIGTIAILLSTCISNNITKSTSKPRNPFF